jgi:hypothetical protein
MNKRPLKFPMRPLFLALFISAAAFATAGVIGDSREQLFEGAFAIRPELRGVHPRLFAGVGDLERSAVFYKNNPELLKKYGPAPSDLHRPPKDPSATVDGSVFVSLARAACAWRVGAGGDAAQVSKPASGAGDYIKLLMSWREAFEKCEPEIFTGKLGKSNEDLRAGHALFGLAVMYDMVKDAAPAELTRSVHKALVKQAAQTHHDLASSENYAYEQNHFSIPTAGLLIAACALADEHPTAARWGVWARNALRRAFDAQPPDGWFFEGASYFSFTAQFTVAAAFVLERATGENWFDTPPLRDAGLYIAHIHTPGSRFVFDFADCGPRADANAGTGQKGYKAQWHSLPADTNFLPAILLARRQNNPLLSDWLREAAPAGGLWRSDAIIRLLLAPVLPATPAPARAEPPPFHYFDDIGVVHWRERWGDPQAAALAFKSGPPAGHRYAAGQPRRPEWRSSLGHAHPDAGSFILFARGVFLAGDTGYVGIKETADHNSILVDSTGQHRGGTTWATFTAKPQSEYDKIRMENVRLEKDFAAATAIFDAAYDDALKLTKMRRDLIFIKGRFLVIRDQMQSAKEHTWQWRLQTDHAPVPGEAGSPATAPPGGGRFIMDNGPARLVVQSLTPGLAHTIAPTIVELSLTPKITPQKHQRGFHLELAAPRASRAEFLTAFCVQSAGENPGDFSADRPDETTIELRAGADVCKIIIAPDGRLDCLLQ